MELHFVAFEITETKFVAHFTISRHGIGQIIIGITDVFGIEFQLVCYSDFCIECFAVIHAKTGFIDFYAFCWLGVNRKFRRKIILGIEMTKPNIKTSILLLFLFSLF